MSAVLIDSSCGELGSELCCDICVIGAGAAGIALAIELLDTDIDVIVLESGGLDIDESLQQLNSGTSTGATRQALESTRLRKLGGATNLWTGLLAPFSKFDFDREAIGDVPGWPVSAVEMSSYYERALTMLQHSGRTFDQSLADDLCRSKVPIDSALIDQSFIHYSSTLNFGQHFKAVLESSDNVRIVLDATAVKLTMAPRSDTLESIEAFSSKKASLAVRASSFVLACGALENSRLLLNSKGFSGLALGNHRDLVGRYLMDHPTGFCGTVTQTGDYSLSEILSDFTHRSAKYRPVLSFPPTQLGSGRPNASCYFWPDKQGPDRLSRIASYLKRVVVGSRGVNSGLEELTRSNTVNKGVTAAGLSSQTSGPLRIKAVLEQTPEYRNRILLGNDRDRLGVPLPHLQWQLGALESRSLTRLMRNLEQEFSRVGVGKITLARWMREGLKAFNVHMTDYNHPMGGTRMATSDEYGVVDQYSRVYSTENLYIAGGSVFSTGSIYNPTLTILALTIRLADRLKQVIAASSA